MKPPHRQQNRHNAIRHGAALLTLVLFISACGTPEKRDKWLRRFFDGVPSKVESTTDAATSGASGQNAPSAKNASSPTVTAPTDNYHEPFAERECAACHESKFSQRMGGTMLETCFTCHDDFIDGAKTIHDPAAEGDCTECHNPHKSPNNFLLKRTGTALCYDCHDDFADGAKTVHDPAAEGDCTECHDPHASKNNTLLKRTGTSLCYDCHDDFADGAEIVHDPVAEGDCTECHDPHASKNSTLLKRTGTALCYECHDEDDIQENQAHNNMDAVDCTACHNPHAGGDFLLKPNWKPASGRGK